MRYSFKNFAFKSLSNCCNEDDKLYDLFNDFAEINYDNIF